MALSTVRPPSGPEGRDQLEHLLLRADVERARRLVEKEQRRVLRDRPGEDRPLSLAAAERPEAPVDEMGPVQAGERGAGGDDVPRARAARVAKVRRPTQDDVLENGRIRRDHRDLGHDGDLAGGRPPAQRSDLLALDPDRARVGHEARHRAQDRRLAGPVRADQAEPLPVLERETHVRRRPGAVELDRDRSTRSITGQPSSSSAGRPRRRARPGTR